MWIISLVVSLVSGGVFGNRRVRFINIIYAPKVVQPILIDKDPEAKFEKPARIEWKDFTVHLRKTHTHCTANTVDYTVVHYAQKNTHERNNRGSVRIVLYYRQCQLRGK